MKLSILLVLCAVSFAACTRKSEQVPVTNEEPASKEAVKIYDTPSLNNGERWKVNEEMMPAIISMEASINAISSDPDPDYKALVNSLETDLERLTKSCTMKGKSHDELHKWLTAYMASVKDLKNAESPGDEQKAFEKLKLEFNRFYEYFE